MSISPGIAIRIKQELLKRAREKKLNLRKILEDALTIELKANEVNPVDILIEERMKLVNEIDEFKEERMKQIEIIDKKINILDEKQKKYEELVLKPQMMEKEFIAFKVSCITEIVNNSCNFKQALDLIQNDSKKFENYQKFTKWVASLERINDRGRWKNQINAWQKDMKKGWLK